jgi:hypothetical protein
MATARKAAARSQAEAHGNRHAVQASCEGRGLQGDERHRMRTNRKQRHGEENDRLGMIAGRTFKETRAIGPQSEPQCLHVKRERSNVV